MREQLVTLAVCQSTLELEGSDIDGEVCDLITLAMTYIHMAGARVERHMEEADDRP